MFFLLRLGFWFSLVLLFLPIWPSGSDNGGQPVGAFRTFVAAQAAISDLSRICEREPEMCETGRAAAQTIGVRAVEGARIAARMIEEHNAAAGSDAISTEALDTGTTGNVGVVPTPQTAILPTPRPDN